MSARPHEDSQSETLRLEVDLRRRLDQRGIEVSWPTLMRDLSQVQAVPLQTDGRSYLLDNSS
jgi:arginine repressor